MSLKSKSLAKIHESYVQVKNACANDFLAASSDAAIRTLVDISLKFLSDECEQVALISKVHGKEYVAYVAKGNKSALSRPANRLLFCSDNKAVSEQWPAWLEGRLKADESARMAYTAALAPCLAIEIFDRQNKKGPATYFECFIGHIFARELGINPKRDASIIVQGQKIRLTMDFLFDGNKGVKVHLPVKMSTRERVVQAWAHQRILDGYFGPNTYKGVMVLFSETKLDLRSHEVIEICVPDQWLAYQALLARIERIYYFDVPSKYRTLSEKFPNLIQVKQFGEFFIERSSLLDH